MSADAMSISGAEGSFLRKFSKEERPGLASSVSASITLAWRALLKIKHVPFQLFDVTAFPIMFTVLFTFLFGGALSQYLGAAPGDTTAYLHYLLPGLIVQTIVFITVYTGVGLATDINKGIFERFRSLPIWQPAPVFGAVLGDMVRYSLAAGVVMTVGVILGFRPQAGIGGLLLGVGVVLIFAFAVSWIWMVVGMKVKTPESVMTTSFLFLFPLVFLSDIFVPPVTMPGWLQSVVAINPVTHLANATRGLMHGEDVLGSVGFVLLASVIIVAIFAPIALRLYRKER